MAQVQISTPSLDNSIVTYLTEDYSSGSTLKVASAVAFQGGQYIVVGAVNLENTESTNITTSPSDNISIPVTPLKFSHPKGTPVYYTLWNGFSLEYRIGNDGSWTIYGGMPFALNFDSLFTEFLDVAATSDYQWRYRYYSTENNAYSDYSSTIGAFGWGRSAVGYMVREIRKLVNDPESKTVTDTEIIRFLNAAQDKVYSLYDRWWFLLKKGDAIATISGYKEYPLPDDFGRMHSVSFNYVNGSTDLTYQLENVSITEYDFYAKDNNANNNDSLKYYSIFPGDDTNTLGYVNIWPKPDTAGLSIIPLYFRIMPDLTNFSDLTLVPIPDVIENYAISQILKIRKEDDKAKIYSDMFKEQVELLKLMQRKNAKPMRSLWEFQGRDAERRLRGSKGRHGTTDRENYWN